MEKRVDAILSVRDNGYFTSMARAQKAAEGLGMGLEQTNKKTGSLKDTMLGMASAIGITGLISKGFDMISASVGKAMDRADTMANFNRTMTLMTGSSEKAGGALEDLRGKVSGTAYGLDVAAKSTQGLVTSGLDLKDSTKYIGGWMDAVSTYGDGTNATLGNVTFQLSQMASKGKANLGDLKSAMEAGIPVIKIYAEATGQSASDVSDQISKGVISSEKFMAVMDNAFRSGTRSFAKIEGAAKNAGGTWKGTFDNMSAATTRGMLSILTAIEDARKDSNLPGMKDAVAEFGKSTEKVLQGVAGIAGFVAQHFETLSTVLVTGLSAWAGYRVIGEIDEKLRAFNVTAMNASRGLESFIGIQGKSVTISNMYNTAMRDATAAEQMRAAARRLNIELEGNSIGGITILNNLTEKQKALILAETGALSLKSLVLAVVSGKITLATAAQIAWNIAMKANPIGMVVAGVAALVGILKFLNGKLTETTKEHKAANKEAEKMASTNESLVKSTQDLSKGYKDNTTDAKANAAEAKRMVDGLLKIQQASMNAEEKQMRMGDAVKELNTAYPELNLQLDKTGTAIKGSTDAIYGQIKAMQEQAKMEAMKDYLKELYKKQIEYEVSISQTNTQMKTMEEQGTKTQKTLFGLGSKTTDEFKKLEESSGSLTTGLSETNGMIAEMETQLNISSEAQLRSRLEQDEQKRSLENLNQQYGVTTFGILDYAEKSKTELEKVGQKVLDLSSIYGLSSDQIIQKVTASGLSLEDWAKQHDKIIEAGEKYGMTADQIEDALNRSGLKLEEWAKQQDKLLEIADKYGLTTDQIKTAVATQKISLEEFAENHEDNLKRAEEAIDTYVGAATNGWGKLEQEQTISLDKYQKNLEANTRATKSWTTNVDKLMKAGVSDSIIKHLESMGPAGAAQAERFVKELEKLNGGALGKWDTLNKKTKERLIELNLATEEGFIAGGKAADKAIEAQNYSSKGEGIILDMKTGIANELSGLETQAKNVQKTVEKAVSKTELKKYMISSGRYAMEGLDEGLNDKKGTIYSTALAIARGISSKFRSALEINSPSRLFRKYGNHVDDGLILGLEDGIPDVVKMSEKMANAVAGPMIPEVRGLSVQQQTKINRPAEIVLKMGRQEFRAYVQDISEGQNSETNLELLYT